MRSDIRAVIWKGVGKSFSSGRDVGSIGTMQVPLSHHELMRRGHRGIQRVWDVDAPVIVACKGWVMGGSFQRALLCDVRIAAEGTRFRLPEVTYGVIPDTGGVAVLYEMCGPGLVSDMVLTGRVLSPRKRSPRDRQRGRSPDEPTRRARWPGRIAAPPSGEDGAEVIRHPRAPEVRSSMTDEMICRRPSTERRRRVSARRARRAPPKHPGS
jgi:hypothetical protein